MASTAVLVGMSLATTVLFVELLLSVHQTAFAVLYQAAAKMASGHSPYRVLSGVRLNEAFVYLPWVALSLVPLTRLNFPVAFHLWVALNGTLAVASAWGMAKALGWRRPWLLAGSVVVWEVLWRGLLTGQVDGVLLAVESASVISAARGRYGLAGLSSVIAALLKPHLMWILPVALLWPAWAHGGRTRYLAGASGAALLLLGGPAVVHPDLLLQWASSLARFSTSIGSIQPDLAGLPGLLRFAPRSWGLSPSLADPVTLLMVAGGLVLIGHLLLAEMRASGLAAWGSVEAAAWTASLPLGIWMLVAPYSHSNDLLVLLPLLAVVVRADFRGAARWDVLGMLAAMVVLPELFLLLDPSHPIGRLSTAGLAVAALVAVAYRTSPWRGSCSPDQMPCRAGDGR